jgi:hypothetical protein
MATKQSSRRLNRSIEECALCERLAAHCRWVAAEKKAAGRV